MKKKMIVIASVMMLSTGTTMAQENFYEVFNHFSINAGIGSEGLSIGVATPVTAFMEFSVGANFMPGIKLKDDDVDINYNLSSVSGFGNYKLKKTSLEGDLSRTTFDAKLNVYPFGTASSFFLTGGLSMGGEKIVELKAHNDEVARFYNDHPEFIGSMAAEFDKYNISFDQKGNAKGEVRVNNVRPYLGLGYGRLVTKNRVGFRFEVGCHFMGHLKVYQGDQEIKAFKKAGENEDISKIMDDLTIYPVIKMAITGRIL